MTVPLTNLTEESIKMSVVALVFVFSEEESVVQLGGQVLELVACSIHLLQDVVKTHFALVFCCSNFLLEVKKFVSGLMNVLQLRGLLGLDSLD